MILKFDEIVFTEQYELKVHKHGELKTLDVNVSLTDEEAKEISGLMQTGKGNNRICEILFNDQLDEIEKLLVGPNITGFITKVLSDFGNFTLQLIQGVVTTGN